MSPSVLPPSTITSMASPAQPPLPPPSIVTTIASALQLPLQTAQPPSSVYMPTTPITSLSATTLATSNQQTSTMVHQVHPSVVSTVFQQTQSAPLVPITPTPTHNEKRRVTKGTAGGGGGTSKKAKKNRGGHQTSTKDLGRWKPIDDLALIIGIQQTNDLRMVHRGTKFSCKFTVQEMQSRWYSLLYEESISRIAVAAMRNLHPELVESVKSKALYTTQEEEVLGTIKSVNNYIFILPCQQKHTFILFRPRIQAMKPSKTFWISTPRFSIPHVQPKRSPPTISL